MADVDIATNEAIALVEDVDASVDWARLGNIVNVTCSAQNMFTPAFNPYSSDSVIKVEALKGKFNLSITGSFTATVTVQKSFDRGDNWADLATTYTAAAEAVLTEIEPGVLYRAGIKTGDYTTGDAVIRIGN